MRDRSQNRLRSLLARDIYKIRNEWSWLCLLDRHLAMLKRVEKNFAGALELYKEEAAYRQKTGDTVQTDRVQADIAACESELKKNPAATP